MSGFSRLHPINLFLFYAVVITVTVLSMNPIIIIASFFGAVIYSIISKTVRKKDIIIYVVLGVMILLINPLVSHNGNTVLFYLNDNRITYEAVLYGVFSAVEIITIIIWCKNLSNDLTEDKILYLLGNLSSDIALIISMVMRFIPMYKLQAEKVSNVYEVIERNEQKNILQKIASKIRIYDSVMLFGIENSIDTADSMKARGYGSGKRSMYHNFYWSLTNTIYIVITISYIGMYIISEINNIVGFYFYPCIGKIQINIITISVYTFTLLVFLLPTIEEVREKIKWKFLVSKI